MVGIVGSGLQMTNKVHYGTQQNCQNLADSNIKNSNRDIINILNM